MTIKNEILLTILSLSLIPAIAIGLILYTISLRTIRGQIRAAHYRAVSAVDALILMTVNDMVNIAFVAAPKIAPLIEKQDYQELKRKANVIDQIDVPNIGTGRGLGCDIVIVTDKYGNILARSNMVKDIEIEIAQKGHILYLDEAKQEEWSYPKNFGIAFNNALMGKPDARKIIYNQEFLRREGYGHLVDEYGFEEMMGLTVFQPIFNEKNEQIGILLVLTILNNNYAAITTIDAVTGTEFTAITPSGKVVSSFFVNPPVLTQEIIAKAQERALEIASGEKSARGKDTIFHTIERIYLRPAQGAAIFRGGDVGTCYVDGKPVPFKKLKERPYRFHFIAEVDPSLEYVSIRGIAYDLTDYDYLVGAQAGYFVMNSLIIFLVALPAGLIMSRKITVPIVKFTQKIQKMEKQIEKKEFGEAVDIKTGDEIEILANAFNAMNKKLAQSYKEVTKQLRTAEIEVLQSAKMAAIGQLAAGVAHEINNPLGGILGYAQFTLSKIGKPGFTPEDFKACEQYIRHIERESQRCKQIVENLLAFSRRSGTKFEPVDIKLIMEITLSVLRHSLGLQNIKITTDYPPQLPLVDGVATQLQQVFANFIINAQQAMPKGGELNISVSVLEKDKKKNLAVSFQDTGCGIPEENLEKIFDPFFTTKEGQKSLGLGLAICYQIIQQHSGEISVSSEVGKGTTFMILLPLKV